MSAETAAASAKTASHLRRPSGSGAWHVLATHTTVNAMHCATCAYVLDSIGQWKALHGEQPTAADWNLAQALKENAAWRVLRYEETQRPWPSVTAVRNHFGTWNAAIAAAGFAPLAPGAGYQLPSTRRDVA